MNTSLVIGLVILGVSAGYLSGLIGIGGGIIIVPILIFFFGFTIQEAQGTSLAALIPPVGILAVIYYYKNGHVNVYAAILIALSFFIGALLGAKTNHMLRTDIIEKIFAALLIVIAINILINPKH